MADRDRNEHGRFTETVTREKVLGAVAATTEDAPVTTASEIGESIGYTRGAAIKKLNQLHDEGAVNRKRVGGNAVVWWLPEGGVSDEEASDG